MCDSDEDAIELLGYKQAEDTVEIKEPIKEQRPIDAAATTGWTTNSKEKRKYRKRQKRELLQKYTEYSRASCPMRCCSRSYMREAGVNPRETRHFKLLCDDLWGLVKGLGYKAEDFPSIMHLLATFQFPVVIDAYRSLRKSDDSNDNLMRACETRVELVRANRERTGDIVGLDRQPTRAYIRRHKREDYVDIKELPANEIIQRLNDKNKKNTASGVVETLPENTDINPRG